MVENEIGRTWRLRDGEPSCGLGVRSGRVGGKPIERLGRAERGSRNIAARRRVEVF